MFHFFGLPAELRNEIYYELLTLRKKPWPDRQPVCWPQILAVSERVHDEAITVFSDANHSVFDFESSTTKMISGVVENRSQIHIDSCRLSSVAFTKDCSIGKEFTRWPIVLKEKTELHLNLTVGCREQEARDQRHRVYITLNHMLYSLCCFISDGRRLRELTVTLSQNHGPQFGHREWSALLWPLAKLSEAIVIVFNGLPSEHAMCVRYHLKKTVAWPVNTLAIAQELLLVHQGTVEVAQRLGRQHRE